MGLAPALLVTLDPGLVWTNRVDRKSEGLLRGLQTYMRDLQHPNAPFLNSVLNIYLNLWHDHARRCTDSEGGAGVSCPASLGAALDSSDGDARGTGVLDFWS